MKKILLGFILLHTLGGNRELLIPTEKITAIVTAYCGNDVYCTKVFIGETNWFEVKESPLEILKMKELK